MVARLHLDTLRAPKSVRLAVGGKAVAATMKPATEGVLIALERPVTLTGGQALVVAIA